MLDEAARISSDARSPAKHVLERREGADPATVFDHHSPYRRRCMQPHEPAPAQCQESADHYEDDERSVKQHDGV